VIARWPLLLMREFPATPPLARRRARACYNSNPFKQRKQRDIAMPVQPESESVDVPRAANKPRRLTLASALAQRERTSASIGSRIHADVFELEVVDIGPYTDRDGNVVTFLARPAGDTVPRTGDILRTAWGICRVVE
jgi:hypothetical protein